MATITAGSQPTEMTGVQLPSLIACAAALTATNTAASPVMTYSHRCHRLMTDLLLSSVLVIDKLALHLMTVKEACHRGPGVTALLRTRRPGVPAHAHQPTATTILPAAAPSSIARCAATIWSNPKTLTGLALYRPASALAIMAVSGISVSGKSSVPSTKALP